MKYKKHKIHNKKHEIYCISWMTSMLNQFLTKWDALRNLFYLYNLKTWKTPMEECLVKLQAETGNFTKSNIPSWLFFTFFKLYTTYCTLTHYLFTYLLINNFRLTYLPSYSSTLVWKSCSNLRCCVQIKKDRSSNLAN